jgi:hypothetical protein
VRVTLLDYYSSTSTIHTIFSYNVHVDLDHMRLYESISSRQKKQRPDIYNNRQFYVFGAQVQRLYLSPLPKFSSLASPPNRWHGAPPVVIKPIVTCMLHLTMKMGNVSCQTVQIII